MAKKGAGEGKARKAEKALVAREVRAVPELPSIAAWERDVEQWFDDFWRRFRMPMLFGRERWPALAALRVEMPSVDVYEKGDDVVVKAEIPGLGKDEIEVDLTPTTLTIRGTKKKEEEVRHEDFYQAERAYGSFARTISLPAEVKTEQAKATFKDGVLEVRLPRAGEAKKSRKIPVQ